MKPLGKRCCTLLYSIVLWISTELYSCTELYSYTLLYCSTILYCTPSLYCTVVCKQTELAYLPDLPPSFLPPSGQMVRLPPQPLHDPHIELVETVSAGLLSASATSLPGDDFCQYLIFFTTGFCWHDTACSLARPGG